MYIITLKFSENRHLAQDHMEAHKDWIKTGFKDQGFLLVGSIKPSMGGAIIAQGPTREAIEAFIEKDPFVAENIVTAEILEISPARTVDPLAFLAQT